MFWAWSAQHVKEATRRERGHNDLVPVVPQAEEALAMANGRERGQVVAWDTTLQLTVLRALTSAV